MLILLVSLTDVQKKIDSIPGRVTVCVVLLVKLRKPELNEPRKSKFIPAAVYSAFTNIIRIS